jgi:hypothetical protein
MAERVVWQIRYVETLRLGAHDGLARSCRLAPRLGQNQPTRVTNSGTAPIGTAQGVKIDPMNSPVVASAASSGQIDGSGSSPRWSGSASTAPVISSSRRSLRSPVTTCRGIGSSHRGARPETTGMSWKFQGCGGEVVAHSSVPAFQGSSPAICP